MRTTQVKGEQTATAQRSARHRRGVKTELLMIRDELTALRRDIREIVALRGARQHAEERRPYD